jgi:hypothetical protein
MSLAHVQVVTPTADLPPVMVHSLKRLEAKIAKSEDDGLRVRWEFGGELLAMRNGKKKLPAGRLDVIAKEVGASRRELQARVKFAEKFPDEERLCNAVTQFQSWRELCAKGLVTKRKTKIKRVTGAALALRRWRKELKQMDFTKDDFRALEVFRADIDRILTEQKKERTTA